MSVSTEIEKRERIVANYYVIAISKAVQGVLAEANTIIAYEKMKAQLKTLMATSKDVDFKKFVSTIDEIISDEQEHKEKFQKQADTLRGTLTEITKAVETRKRNVIENAKIRPILDDPETARKRKLFEKVQNQSNWKLPTKPFFTKSLTEANEMKEAIIFFAGDATVTSLKGYRIQPSGSMEAEPKRLKEGYVVESKGYYKKSQQESLWL